MKVKVTRSAKATTETASEEAEPIGLREGKKSERLMKIKEAARALFLKTGYDRTTLRTIGARAGIPAATILRYVEDKRDLLYLLFNEDHAKITEAAVQEIAETRGFLDESIAGFRHYYRYFAAHPDFARCVLREATFLVRRAGNHAFEASSRSLKRIKRIVTIARARGEIRHPATDEDISQLIFELYQSETRRWLLATAPDVESGLRSLRASLSIVMEGLSGGGRTPRSGQLPRRSRAAKPRARVIAITRS